ncbi:putative porin [Blattabacterium cuenoti]|uniref:putative porin n=1 Tax=Blattabacterium cuenoti TaxID=1653831 RepID=UPI001EEC6DDB|nr:putative porin [Blattabacterium cuenoti]
MEEKIPLIYSDEKKEEEENVKFYHPTSQDYKFWTEEINLKKTFGEKDFSIKKYYSHNFFKEDYIGFFFKNEKYFFIPYEKFMKKSFNENMPKKMLFFKDPFFYREKIQYFDVKTPISEIFYINDFFREKTLGGFFSHNFNEKINYSMEYRNSYLKNEPDLKKSQDLVLTTFNYQDQNDYNYKLWGHYIYQKFDTIDKEEVQKWNSRNSKDIFSYSYHKKLIHSRFYVSLIQKIFSLKEKSLFLKSYMEYEKYYKNHSFHYPYKFDSTQDLQKKKINHSYLRNGLFLIFNQRKMNIEIGSVFDKIYYKLFNNVFNNYKNKNINNFSIQTKINYPINNVFKFYSNVKWMLENNSIKKSNYEADIMLNAFLFSKFFFITQFNIVENDNGIYNNLISNRIFNTNQDFCIGREKAIDFSLSSYDKKNHISFYISRLNHSFKHKEMEKFLYNKDIQLYGFKIKSTHSICKFQFNNIFLYQKYNYNPPIFYIPNFISRSTIFYEDNYFEKALFMQIGFSFHYFSKFYHKKIHYPFNFQSYFFDKEYISNKRIDKIPFIDYFLNFKIYRTVFYFSIQNMGFYNIYNPNNNNKWFIQTGFLWNLFT